MLNVFSGPVFFGFIEIMLGLVLMTVIVTTMVLYLEVCKNMKNLELEIKNLQHFLVN